MPKLKVFRENVQVWVGMWTRLKVLWYQNTFIRNMRELQRFQLPDLQEAISKQNSIETATTESCLFSPVILEFRVGRFMLVSLQFITIVLGKNEIPDWRHWHNHNAPQPHLIERSLYCNSQIVKYSSSSSLETRWGPYIVATINLDSTEIMVYAESFHLHTAAPLA